MVEIKGDINNYKTISYILFAFFFLNSLIIFLLNTICLSTSLQELMGENKALLIQLFFWAALGATIACSLFMSRDKEKNELERVKKEPDPEKLMYPDIIDVYLYIQRIISSGILGIFGAILCFAGFGYFEISIDNLSIKHALFLIIICFLIGMYQPKFLDYISSLAKRFFHKTNQSSKDFSPKQHK